MKSQRRPSSHTDPSKLPRPRWKLQGVESRVHQASPPRQSPCPVPVCAQPRGFLPNQPLGVLPLLSASSQLGGDPHATRARPPATPCGIGRSNSSPRARFSTLRGPKFGIAPQIRGSSAPIRTFREVAVPPGPRPRAPNGHAGPRRDATHNGCRHYRHAAASSGSNADVAFTPYNESASGIGARLSCLPRLFHIQPLLRLRLVVHPI